MPRPPRVYIPDISFHVFPRGIDGTAIVRDDYDRMHLLGLIRRVAGGLVRVHAFSIMTTHYHMIVTPNGKGQLSKAMMRIGIAHTLYFNAKYGRTGTIWNERYGATLLDDERYWYTCLRYVELNPFRAGMVRAPEDSRWSSYRTHALGALCDWLTPHPLYTRLGSTPARRQEAYRRLCNVPLTDLELAAQRYPPIRSVAVEQLGLTSDRPAPELGKDPVPR
jgi:putative transposase